MADFESMLDGMTEDDINALKEALEKHKTTQKKSDICKTGLKAIRETFWDDERYRDRGIIVENEVKNALFVLCDTVTSNYVPNTRVLLHGDRHGKTWKHNSFVPKDKQELYKRTFNRLLEIVLSNKIEPNFPE